MKIVPKIQYGVVATTGCPCGLCMYVYWLSLSENLITTKSQTAKLKHWTKRLNFLTVMICAEIAEVVFDKWRSSFNFGFGRLVYKPPTASIRHRTQKHSLFSSIFYSLPLSRQTGVRPVPGCTNGTERTAVWIYEIIHLSCQTQSQHIQRVVLNIHQLANSRIVALF